MKKEELGMALGVVILVLGPALAAEKPKDRVEVRGRLRETGGRVQLALDEINAQGRGAGPESGGSSRMT